MKWSNPSIEDATTLDDYRFQGYVEGGPSKRAPVELLDGRFAAASHTHAQSEVTGLVAALAGKAPSSHAHAIADTTGLQAALDGKAAASHTHAQSEVTGLVAALAGKAPSSHAHAIADTTGLQAALDDKAAASHTHAQSEVTGLVAALAGKAPSSHAHAIADTTGLQAALDGKAAASHTHSQSEIGGLGSTIAGLESEIASKAAASHSHVIGDLPVASEAEAQAGTENAKLMTPLRVAQAIAAQAGVVSDYGVIYVAANGNDTTGDGSPGKPYASIQKAWDSGRSGESLVARLGVGNFGSLQIDSAGNPNLTFIGQGNHLSLITDISVLASVDMDGSLNIQGGGVDVGVLTTNVSSLSLTGPFRISFAVSCRSDSPGGPGGSVSLLGGVFVAYVDASGVRGVDGDAETPAGAGGNGGSIFIDGSQVANGADAVGGPPGTDNGGGGGATGMNGSVQASNFSVLGFYPTSSTYVVACVVNGTFHALNTLP